jgi:hypothetical protein
MGAGADITDTKNKDCFKPGKNRKQGEWRCTIINETDFPGLVKKRIHVIQVIRETEEI